MGGSARLPVDRVFPLKGIGTVVTGTLWRGEIRAGDALVVEPGGARTAVRSVQVHDHEAEVVRAGSRVGVNLRGLDRDAVERGSWLVAPEAAGHVCRRFDAWVQVVPGGRPLRSGDQVRLHHGTAQYLARVAPLEGREIAAGCAGGGGRAARRRRRRRAARPLHPARPLAGGDGRRRRGARHRGRAAGTIAGVTPPFSPRCVPSTSRAAAVALAADSGRGGVVAADLAAAGFGAGEAGAALAAAEKAGELEALRCAPASGTRAAPVRWFGAGTLAALRADLLAGASARCRGASRAPVLECGRARGARAGAARGRRGRAPPRASWPTSAWSPAKAATPPPAPACSAAAQAALADALLARLGAEPFAPPTLASLAEALRRPSRELSQVLDVLARRGDVVRVDKDLWFAAAAIDDARTQLLAMLAADGRVTLAGFRDRLDCGRRNAQALLELFDREGLTLRRGDERIPRRRRSLTPQPSANVATWSRPRRLARYIAQSALSRSASRRSASSG